MNLSFNMQIILFLSFYYSIFALACYILRNKRIYGRILSEYIWPVKFYIVGSAIAVFWQYLGFLPETGRMGQILWSLMVILSVVKLRKSNFNLKNIAILGVIYSILIHGSKVSLRYFIYGMIDPFKYRSFQYIAGRFFYGTILVMLISIGTGVGLYLLDECNKKNKNYKKILMLLLSMLLILVLFLIAGGVYGPIRNIPSPNET